MLGSDRRPLRRSDCHRLGAAEGEITSPFATEGLLDELARHRGEANCRADIRMRRVARWARLELATDGLENRCSIRLSYHRVKAKTCCEAVALEAGADKAKTTLDLGWIG